MKIHVRLFAILRDTAGGIDAFELELADGVPVSEAIVEIGERHPRLWSYLPQTAAAVNRAYVSRDHMLSDGDELALIPPVSGG